MAAWLLRLRRWMDEEISNTWCLIGWMVATGIFALFARLSGGPAWADGSLSLYSTWAIAHGEFVCAFPSVTVAHQPLIGPVYPLFSGSVAAIARYRPRRAFPGAHAAMGASCQHADAAIGQWATRAGASDPTRAIAYASWFFLLAGIVGLAAQRRPRPLTLGAGDARCRRGAPVVVAARRGGRPPPPGSLRPGTRPRGDGLRAAGPMARQPVP